MIQSHNRQSFPMLLPTPPQFRKRRGRAKSPSAPPPPTPPTVLSAVVDTFSTTVDVTFSQPVTWDGAGNGEFDTSVGGGSWTFQLAPNVMRLSPNCGSVFAIGADWSWDAPDTSLSPTPDPAQSGVC